MTGPATFFRRVRAQELSLLKLELTAKTENVTTILDCAPPWDPTTARLRPGAGAEESWERGEAADLSLTRFLLGESTELGALEHEYGRAFATRSSRRDRDSVVDHLRGIAEVHGEEDPAELARRLDGRL